MRKSSESKFDNTVNLLQRADVSILTLEIFVEQYQKTGIPVVITGLVKECDWNLDYLCKKLGTQEFLLRCYGQQRYKQDKRKWTNIGSGVETHSLPFNKYADLLRNHEAHEKDIYLAKHPISKTQLEATHSLSNIGDQLGLNKPFSDFNLWIGPGGHVEC